MSAVLPSKPKSEVKYDDGVGGDIFTPIAYLGRLSFSRLAECTGRGLVSVP